MPFVDGPRLRYIGLGFYETETLTTYVGKTDVITIPVGFRTDLASVPRIFWWILPPTGAYENGAVIHDHGCEECARAYREGRPPRMPPRDVDGLFVRILREADEQACRLMDERARIPPWKRRLLWLGVRYGAAFNPARRPGIGRDVPLLLAAALVALAVLYAVWWLLAELFWLLPWT